MSAIIRIADLAGRHARVADAVTERVAAVLASGCWVGGPEVRQAEATCAKLLNAQHAVGVACGTDALILSLQALGVRAGDEVIVPALTFFATAGAVCALGARPRVVDVNDDGTLDPAAAREACTDATTACIVVHLWGQPAARPDVTCPILDDAAQAIGTHPAPRHGALAAVSCYPTKTWGASGDAGFVVGDDAALLDAVRALGNHGATAPHEHATVAGHVGRASRLDALQAAVLNAHAVDLPRRLAARRAFALHYDEALPAHVRRVPRAAGSSVHQYLVRVSQRDQVQARLHALGIETAVYYPRPLHHQPALAERLAPGSSAPNAEEMCAELLALPVHDGLTAADIERVCDAVQKALV